MNNPSKMKTLRLGPALLCIWISYLVVANYLSFWNHSHFAQIVSPGDPVYTVHSRLAGWPLTYGSQIYSRQTTPPSISFESDLMRGLWNLLLCGSVLISAYFLFWNMKHVSILHMLKLTASVAIIIALANHSAAAFGWNIWYCVSAYVFVSPLAVIAAKIPYFTVTKTLKFMRRKEHSIAT